MARATYRGVVQIPGTLLTTTNTLLYKAPEDDNVLHGLINYFSFGNFTAAEIVVNGYLVEDGDSPGTDNNIWPNMTIPPGQVFPFSNTIMINPGAEIWFESAADDTVNIYASGAVVTE